MSSKKVPRVSTINTVEELEDEYKAFHSICKSTHCEECALYEDGIPRYGECFKKYLAGGIEVEK